MYFLEFLSVNETILEVLKWINGKSSQGGKVLLIYLEILLLYIETEKIIKNTYLHTKYKAIIKL